MATVTYTVDLSPAFPYVHRVIKDNSGNTLNDVVDTFDHAVEVEGDAFKGTYLSAVQEWAQNEVSSLDVTTADSVALRNYALKFQQLATLLADIANTLDATA